MKTRYINICRASQKCFLAYKRNHKPICTGHKWYGLDEVYRTYSSIINIHYRMKLVTRSIFKFRVNSILNSPFTINRYRKEIIK